MDLEPEHERYLEFLKQNKIASSWMARAFKFAYDYEHYKKGFFIRLIEEHFEEIKDLLRKIGRIRKENINK